LWQAPAVRGGFKQRNPALGHCKQIVFANQALNALPATRICRNMVTRSAEGQALSNSFLLLAISVAFMALSLTRSS
jgi:hypothetical protein